MTIFRVDGQSELKRKDRRTGNNPARRCERPAGEGSDVDDGVRRFHGDGLVVRMHSNHRTLEITGDGCRIVLTKNSGSVHVVGDGCSLRVRHNVGDIEYTGDGGRVLLGPESTGGRVRFVGDGGKVIFDSSAGTDPGWSSEERRNEEITCVQKTVHSREGIIRERRDGRPWCREDLDNAVNDLKESSRGKCGARDAETRKSTRHPTVTRIVTKIQSDGRCVRQRFGDSSLIVNSRSDEATRPVMKAASVGLASAVIQ